MFSMNYESAGDRFAADKISWREKYSPGLKVLGKSVGLCRTTKRKDQLHISLLVSVWRIICQNFNPDGLILAEI